MISPLGVDLVCKTGSVKVLRGDNKELYLDFSRSSTVKMLGSENEKVVVPTLHFCWLRSSTSEASTFLTQVGRLSSCTHLKASCLKKARLGEASPLLLIG